MQIREKYKYQNINSRKEINKWQQNNHNFYDYCDYKMPGIISKVHGSTESMCQGSRTDTIHFTLLALCPTMGKVLGEVLEIHQRSKPTSSLIPTLGIYTNGQLHRTWNRNLMTSES